MAQGDPGGPTPSLFSAWLQVGFPDGCSVRISPSAGLSCYVQDATTIVLSSLFFFLYFEGITDFSQGLVRTSPTSRAFFLLFIMRQDPI